MIMYWYSIEPLMGHELLPIIKNLLVLIMDPFIFFYIIGFTKHLDPQIVFSSAFVIFYQYLYVKIYGFKDTMESNISRLS